MTRGVLGEVGLAMALLLVVGCRPAGPGEARFEVMGTFASVMAGGAERERVGDYAELCRRRMEALEAVLSLYRPDSELCRLNAMSGRAAIPVSEDLRAALALALRYGALSKGAFDVTVGPLVKLWGFSGGIPPTQPLAPDRLVEARARVGYQRLHLDGSEARLDGTNMVVDLGGVAKGYAVDVCYDELRRHGARDFVVNLGGNMRCLGQPEAGRPWRVGVRDPFNETGVIGSLALRDGMAVATSGHYERFIVLQGKRYAHIIDPRTGRPVEGMAGVTVVAPSAGEADALSTALFVMGPEAGATVVASLPDVAALFIPDRQPMEVLITAGMTNWFAPGAGTRPRIVGPVPSAPRSD